MKGLLSVDLVFFFHIHVCLIIKLRVEIERTLLAIEKISNWNPFAHST